jgi:hypothetical protein
MVPKFTVNESMGAMCVAALALVIGAGNSIAMPVGTLRHPRREHHAFDGT